MDKAATEKNDFLGLVNTISDNLNSDFLVLNYEIVPPIDIQFIHTVSKRRNRKSVFLILTTEGGSADSAYRMMRFLQSRYEKITVIVGGWCKSAGTLMCIGAHEIMMGNMGELGPLDVQIVKADEMDEQKSGLVAEAAFEKLQQEAFKFFVQFVRDIGGTEYRVTLKTASDIAAKMTIGVVQPIIEKLEPVTIGEDYRSNKLAQAYAERLNMKSQNLRNRDFDALYKLLYEYPSHGFVIDRAEATQLFKVVKPIPDEMIEIMHYLGPDSVLPRNRRSDQQPRLEFLNDPIKIEERAAQEISVGGEDSQRHRRRAGRENGDGNVSGSAEKGSSKISPVNEAAAA